MNASKSEWTHGSLFSAESGHTKRQRFRASALVAALGLLAGCSSDFGDQNDADDDEIIGAQSQAAVTPVAPNDWRIAYDGALFPTMDANAMRINRFDQATLQSPGTQFGLTNAKMTTGASIRIRATATSIKAKFRLLTPVKGNIAFSIYQNDTFVRDVVIKNQDIDSYPHAISFPLPQGTDDTYRIVLPHWSDPVFEGFDIAGSLHATLPQNKKRYFAIGDSISHGYGQTMTRETFPFLIANRFDMDLFNVAVGGSKISPSVGAMIQNKQIDFVTILIGFNDWNGSTDGIVAYKDKYEKLITFIRNHHPDTPIACVSPIVTNKPASEKKPNVPLSEYRKAVSEVVEGRKIAKDEHIFLVRGEDITFPADLVKDGVHLSVDGAKNFAKRLGDRIVSYVP